MATNPLPREHRVPRELDIPSIAKNVSNWFDVLFSMIFDPENYELKRAVYFDKGYEYTEDWKYNLGDIAKSIQSTLAASHSDKLRDAVRNATMGTPLGMETLPRPEIIQLVKVDPTTADNFNHVLEMTDLYNKEALKVDGAELIDGYLVANTLWQSGILQTGSEDEIRTAIEDIGHITNIVGNPYFAMAIYQGGLITEPGANGKDIQIYKNYDDLNGIAQQMGTTLQDMTLGQFQTFMRAHRHDPDLTEETSLYYDTIAANAAFWKDEDRAEITGFLKENGLHVPEDHLKFYNEYKAANTPETTLTPSSDPNLTQ
jgi:hypothetical protein